jgi:hypothetical protein
MSKIIRLEALIATPPTSKCQETLAILEELVRRHPDNLRLVVFKRGVDFMPDELRLEPPESDQSTKEEAASTQMRILIRKGSVVPACVMDGVVFCAAQVPGLEELDARTQEILRTTASMI